MSAISRANGSEPIGEVLLTPPSTRQERAARERASRAPNGFMRDEWQMPDLGRV